MLVNRANLNDLYTGFKGSFKDGLNSADPQWEKVATKVTSTTAQEKYAWMGQFPRMREWIGDRVIKSLSAHDYTIKNRKFESTIGVGRDDIEDDTYGVFAPLFQEMGYAAAVHPEELVFGLYKDGFSQLCYDGQNYFDADHPVADATVSNLQAGAGQPWFLLDTRRPLKPIIFQVRRDYNLKGMTDEGNENVFMRDEFLYGVDARANAGYGFWQQAMGSKATLDETNFDAAMAAMIGYKNDEGRPLGIRPNLLVCGPSNRSAALALIGRERNAAGESNVNFQAVDLLITPWVE